MWDAAVQGIQASGATPSPLDLEPHRFTFLRRLPVVITGNAGAGKTRLWSKLTVRGVQSAMSVTRDNGYMIGTVNQKKRALALTTIPGQPARPRAIAMRLMFGEETQVAGVVFVASAGFDHIWPSSSDVVAYDLRQDSKFHLDGIIERNQNAEEQHFAEVCGEIRAKFALTDGDSGLAPRWLLVVVNKADLYWPRINAVAGYYLPGCDSKFDRHAQRLLDDVGRSRLQYYVLPVATEVAGYSFQSSYGAITAPSLLNGNQRDASIVNLVHNLGELHDI